MDIKSIWLSTSLKWSLGVSVWINYEWDGVAYIRRNRLNPPLL